MENLGKMNKILLTLFMLLFTVTSFGQSYDQLWKDVKTAQDKDLPKTEADALYRIVAKAQRGNDYGQMLAASLQRASVLTEVSPDSLKSEVARLESLADSETSPAAKAVWYTVLGNIYKSNRLLGDGYKEKGAEYISKAIENPDALAKVTTTVYKPLVKEGIDSKLFNNDLLHVIGYAVGDYATLNRYYDSHGNSDAACLSALSLIDKNLSLGTKEEIQKLDSLLNRYEGVPASAEVAIRRYELLPYSNNDERKAKYEYGEQILRRYADWKSIGRVAKGQKQLTQPMLRYDGGEDRLLPNEKRFINFSARHTGNVVLTLTKLNMNGDASPSLYNDTDLKKVLAKKIKSTEKKVTKPVVFAHDFDVNEDSVEIPSLHVGVWLMELSTDDGNVESCYDIIRVSNVAVVTEGLPKSNVRIAVVNATTGQSLPKAKVRITERQGYGKKSLVETLTADNNGEVTYQTKNYNSIEIWASTDDDKAAPEDDAWGGYTSEKSKTDENVRLFTDRSIYRPGQIVHVNAILYSQDNEQYTMKSIEGRKFDLDLFDANGKNLESKSVTTDKYGSASADFALPSSGLTGQFRITANTGAFGTVSFNVEEYKRPTFEVTVNDYKDAYRAGDTITVSGLAKTYAGVPVQGAKVEYTVKRTRAWWWYWWDDDANNDNNVYTGTATTADDGTFKMTVPFTLPEQDILAMRKGKRIYRYYNFDIDAKVTDVGGESHEGQLSLPLGTHPTALSCDLPDKIQRDSLKSVTFKRVNAAGKVIAGDVRWKISSKTDDGSWLTVKANSSTAMPTLSSGSYKLTAVCEGDTLMKNFVVFSVKDKHPVVETHDWFWQSASQFPRDGKPAYVQFGSSDDNQHVLYTLLSGDKILEQGHVDQSNAITTREFKYRPEYGDGIVLTLAWVRDGNTYTHRAEIRRPEPDNKLRLMWKTFRNNLVPGQKEEWTLSILSPDGKPADAQLMATLYDKSLDQIKKHQWSFSPSFLLMLPSAQWNGMSFGNLSGSSLGSVSLPKVSELEFSSIDDSYYDELLRSYAPFRRYKLMIRDNSVRMMAAPMEPKAEVATLAVDKAVGVGDSVDMLDAVVTEEGEDDKEGQASQLRENLNETAFFYPQLTTDKNGNVAIKFTLPESVTTWRFMGLAHDANVNYGLIDAEAVAKKTVMVQPNIPRFVRQGDKTQITTRIFNTSDKPVSGKTRFELIDPSTEKVVYSEEKVFEADSNATVSEAFNIDLSKPLANKKSLHEGEGTGLFIARVTADGNDFSDGEQHYLPILSDKEFVTNTYPFTQIDKGTKVIPLESVLPAGVSGAKVKFEYTNNPTWLMVQALPYVSNPNDKNAISLVTAYFANSIARQIMNSDPKIKSTFEQWRREPGSETSLMSSLQKDQELKSLVLEETPWVADADNEAEQKRSLANYFDENSINAQLSTIYSQLKGSQNYDGSFSWWPGMDASFYMTVAVVKTLTRLSTMVPSSTSMSINASQLVRKAWPYLDKEVAKRVAEMKRLEQKKIKVCPSDVLCDYVYTSALAKRATTSDINYIVELIEKMPRDLTIYGKANSAVILAMYGKKKVADEYLQSIQEYSVYKEEMGRYFDTRKAQYSWFDYKIPTQTAVIEAYRLLRATDTKTITDLQRWLLQEKRTQAWDTPLNSANAIYAFLGGDTATSQLSELAFKDPVKLSVGSTAIALPQGTAGLGYVKSDISEECRVKSEESNSLKVVKTSDGVSWGAVYSQFFQPTTDIKALASGLTVKREVLDANGKKIDASSSRLKVGDKVRIRITVTADRDYDFVQVIDKRAACLEPVSQLSGYHWGYYIAPYDYTTNYYFDRMAKGEHVVETEYYVDRAGEYRSGTSTAQCAYAPEFMGREGVVTFSVR